MNENEAHPGVRVRVLRAFVGVPEGTEGVVDEIYEDGDGRPVGCMVAWDLPDRPLPPDYRKYDGRPAIQSGLLRDGFSWDELGALDAIRGPLPNGYWHKEAFALMEYGCKVCGDTEQLWNSRDGVTPFSIPCKRWQCNEADDLACPMTHVNWHNDRCYPEFVPHPGLRVFIDIPESIARAVTRMRWNRYLGTCEANGIEPSESRRTQALMFEDIYREGHAPWMIEI